MQMEPDSISDNLDELMLSCEKKEYLLKLLSSLKSNTLEKVALYERLEREVIELKEMIGDVFYGEG